MATAGSVVVAGEAVVDLVGADDVNYRAVPGGSPANVAVGLARLGASTFFLGRLSSSHFGDVLRQHLTVSGVRLDLALPTTQRATLAVVNLDDDGAASYDFYAQGTADWGWLDHELPRELPDDTVAFCLGSIAAFRPPGADALFRLAARTQGRATIVVDPNIRASLIGPREEVGRRWSALLDVADVVKASDQDVAWLAPGASVDEAVAEWAKSGPGLIVVTCGEEGAFAVTAGGAHVDVPAPAIDIVDTVGAGDSFSAALVDSLLHLGALGVDSRSRLAEVTESELRAVIGRAATAAAITCGRRGADPPSADDMMRRCRGALNDASALNLEQVLLAIQRVQVGTRATWHVIRGRVVSVEVALQHALAAGQAGQR